MSTPRIASAVTDPRPIGRRAILKAAAVAAGAAAAPAFIRHAGASTPRKVTFQLAWIPSGQHAYVFAAKPFWLEKGLDVQVDRGFGSGETAKGVGLDKYDFGEASYSVVVNSVGQGLELMAIGGRIQRTAFAIFALKGSGITRPKDLEGKTVIASTGSGEYVLFPALAKLTGIDAAKVKFLLVAPPVRHPMLLERKADALSGYLVSDGAVLLGQGAELDIIPYAEHGLRLLDLGLFTQRRRVREDPKLCADFVEGAMKGLRVALVDPKAGVDLTLASVKEYQGASAAPSILEHGVEIANALTAVPAVKRGGLGTMDPEDWTTTVDLVTRYMGLTQAMPAATLYTNQFAGTVKLEPAEWTAVEARVRKFIKL